MALKAVLTKEQFDALEDGLKQFYIEKDGKFLLDAEGVEDVSGLKSALQKERDAVKQLKDELNSTVEKFKDIDPDRAREAQQKLQEIEDKKLMDEGKVNELLAVKTERMKADYENQIKAFNGKIESMAGERDRFKTKLSQVLIDNALRSAAVKAGVQETALEDVVLRGQKVWRLVEEVPTPMEGDQVIIGKDPNKHMSMEEYMEELQETAPHLFKGTGGGGANNDIKATKAGVSLTRDAARDPQAYQAAKERASKMGVELQITD